mmetsp:Transcript_12752/g.20173  ORF Transcript_12752/g.20173 Transcript_12752/m.20173 type:complete len:94 (+) Transcript_12752:2-283(+)
MDRLRRLMEENDGHVEQHDLGDVGDMDHNSIPQVVSMSPPTVTAVMYGSPPNPNNNEASQEKLLDKIVPLPTRSYSPVPDGEQEDDSRVNVYD